MPTETIEQKSGAASIEAPATGSPGPIVDGDATPTADRCWLKASLESTDHAAAKNC